MTGVAKPGEQELERLAGARLSVAERDALLERQTECTVVFSREGGWPAAVIMSFMRVDGIFWLTATSDRQQVTALARDPRMSIVVSNAGTGTPGRQMVSYRGVGTVHRDRETLDWFLPLWAERLAAPGAEEAFIRLLDTPNRVVIAFRPVALAASHDSRLLAGDGRGGPGPDHQDSGRSL
ncbi:pyridoxamine 5'-phosphate oxidase family protein [Nocardioides caldifontis]|uniref:pyridoxamine 5'-phosphate oxidase family protein n=1 Tax=Nocardioides caldifontis TaxID=2588938 RepID=UPI0019397408|nr:pyridoxamine 5'-phosphate oxidase family protein [Nocardioides caldifontis]